MFFQKILRKQTDDLGEVHDYILSLPHMHYLPLLQNLCQLLFFTKISQQNTLVHASPFFLLHLQVLNAPLHRSMSVGNNPDMPGIGFTVSKN